MFVGYLRQFLPSSLGQPQRCCNEQLNFGGLHRGKQLYKRGHLSRSSPDSGSGRPYQGACGLANSIRRRREWWLRRRSHQRRLIPLDEWLLLTWCFAVATGERKDLYRLHHVNCVERAPPGRDTRHSGPPLRYGLGVSHTGLRILVNSISIRSDLRIVSRML